MIYLYLKTHRVTGLKYFGKFSPGKQYKDVHSYPGSGTHWVRHLKKHGYDYTTEVIGEFDDIEEAKKVAIQYSFRYNIVESDEYANLKPEDAEHGGHGGRPDLIYTPAVRKKMSDAKRTTITKQGTAFLTRPHTDEAKAKMSAKAKQRVAEGWVPPNAGKVAGWNKGLKTGPQKRYECEVCGKMVAATHVKRHKDRHAP